MPGTIMPRTIMTEPPDLATGGLIAGRARPAAGAGRDNFVVLRTFAVLLIIYGNDWMLLNLPGPGFWGVPLPQIGYGLLFAVSGYRVTAGWDRTPSPAAFLAGRLVRVLPGLAVSVLATAFVIGPLCTTLRLRQYFLNGRTLRYLENAYLHLHLWLPGVFVGQASAGEVNPVLWSLLAGALCCAVLPLPASLPRGPRPAALAVAAAGCGAASLYLQHGVQGSPALLFGVSLPDILGMVPFFAVGALLRTLERRWPDLYRADFALLGYAANWVVASWYDWWDVPVAWLTLPYMAICFGRLSAPLLRRVADLGDLSYGLFLYAFPIQQAVLALRPGSAYAVPAALALTLVAAWLSWHCVERPAMAWKYRLADRLRAGMLRAIP